MQFVKGRGDVLLQDALRLLDSDFRERKQLGYLVIDFYDLRRNHQRVDVVYNNPVWFVRFLCYFV